MFHETYKLKAADQDITHVPLFASLEDGIIVIMR